MDLKGRTALHLAAYKGETLSGLALLRMGARLDIKDSPYDRTPVAAALSAGYREAAKAFEEEATRSRPASAATSLGMSTRPPSVSTLYLFGTRVYVNPPRCRKKKQSPPFLGAMVRNGNLCCSQLPPRVCASQAAPPRQATPKAKVAAPEEAAEEAFPAPPAEATAADGDEYVRAAAPPPIDEEALGTLPEE